MSNLFGGGGKTGSSGTGNAGGGYWLTGGGANAPFEMGPTPFDLASIAQSVMGNKQAVTNRYNQLGLGGSTMQGQDVANADTIGQALTGQEQTADVTNPALNPALQPAINQLVGVQNAASNSSSSGNLASALGTALTAGGSALGGAAADAGSFAGDAALGAAILA